ncbi:hypothetical protein, partial [Pseudomonas gingeri]|uniref:hypothetical protein n=1 Tax=Pseudomonas gingeri TaxID=117681 RepID=UPI001C42F4A4
TTSRDTITNGGNLSENDNIFTRNELQRLKKELKRTVIAKAQPPSTLLCAQRIARVGCAPRCSTF